MAAHMRDDGEVWIVYCSGDFVAILDNERDAENMCLMLGEFYTWQRFVAAKSN